MNDLKNLNCLRYDTQNLLLYFIENATFLYKYVFVGGSALTLHLCHRQSEDLDFFTYQDNFNKKEIIEFVKTFNDFEIVNETIEQIDFLINNVKITFFNAGWNFLMPQKKSNFNLATLESISGMKINTLFLRAKFRDYYDIYTIAQKLDIQTIFNEAKKVVVGINRKLFFTALLYIDDIEDDDIAYLNPKINITKKDIRAFFEKELF